MRTIVVTVIVTVGLWCCVAGVALGIIKVVGMEKGLAQHARVLNQLIQTSRKIELDVAGKVDKRKR